MGQSPVPLGGGDAVLGLLVWVGEGEVDEDGGRVVSILVVVVDGGGGPGVDNEDEDDAARGRDEVVLVLLLVAVARVVVPPGPVPVVADADDVSTVATRPVVVWLSSPPSPSPDMLIPPVRMAPMMPARDANNSMHPTMTHVIRRLVHAV